jgi:hypothetical protein
MIVSPFRHLPVDPNPKLSLYRVAPSNLQVLLHPSCILSRSSAVSVRGNAIPHQHVEGKMRCDPFIASLTVTVGTPP